MQSRRKGILISYMVLVLKTLFRFLLTYLYLRILGAEEYGFYQYIYAIASYATILDFGVSSVINKFGIEYKQKGDLNGYKNILFYCISITAVASIVIVIMALVISHNIINVYGSMSSSHLVLAKGIIIAISVQLISLLFQHYYEGIILAEEKYVTLKMINLVQVIIQGVCIILLLNLKLGTMAIALGDMISSLLCLAFEFVFVFFIMRCRAKFYYFDRELLASVIKLATALCLQSVILYMNSTIDKYILGRNLEKSAVTVYTLALTFSTFFDEIPTIIQRLYLPEAVKRVANGAEGEELTNFTVKPGRIQFVLCCTLLGGFILFGRHFLILWSGKDTLDAWWIALLLMLPSIIPLIENVLLTVLTAMNKRMFRSIVLFFVALGNLILTIILVPILGLAGAPIGTMIALIIGNNIAMNIYYNKNLGIQIKVLFKNIFKGILPCWIISLLICLPLLLIDVCGILWFITQCLIYLVVFFSLLYFRGLNNEERELISNLTRKYLKKERRYNE